MSAGVDVLSDVGAVCSVVVDPVLHATTVTKTIVAIIKINFFI